MHIIVFVTNCISGIKNKFNCFLTSMSIEYKYFYNIINN